MHVRFVILLGAWLAATPATAGKPFWGLGSGDGPEPRAATKKQPGQQGGFFQAPSTKPRSTENEPSMLGKAVHQIGSTTKATVAKTKQLFTPKPLPKPNLKLPEMKAPQLKLPEMKMPTVRLPKLKFPSLASKPASQPKQGGLFSPRSWKLPGLPGGSAKEPRVAQTPQEFLRLPMQKP